MIVGPWARVSSAPRSTSRGTHHDCLPPRLHSRNGTAVRDHRGSDSQGRQGGARGVPHDYRATYPKAPAKLDRDWTQCTAFYDYPAEHWRQLRTTNPIQSALATVRLRTHVTKGAGSQSAALAMAYKLLATAQERWRRFNGHHLVADGTRRREPQGRHPSHERRTTTTTEMTDERVAAYSSFTTKPTTFDNSPILLENRYSLLERLGVLPGAKSGGRVYCAPR